MMKCTKNILLFLFAAALLARLDADAALLPGQPEWSQLTFEYTPEQIAYLKELPKPNAQVSDKHLDMLIKETSYLVGTTQLSPIDQTIMPAYLANAQKDFVWLSYLLTGEATGDLTPVTLWTTQLFIPEAKLGSAKDQDFDVFTSCLAAIVVKKASERLAAERKQIADYPIRKEEGLWHPTSPGYRGLNYGSAKTWFLTASNEFLADNPSSQPDFWMRECDKIKAEQKNLDGQKVQAVFEWAGLTGFDAGSWEAILNRYLEEKKAPLFTRLYARSLFLSALADSNAAAFNSKYTFWVMRPSQMDKEVNPLITVPNHPSYPSAHSTISGTAAVVLTALFPDNKAQWDNLREEAGMSRIWGGIHYPADHAAGLRLGEKVGQAVLQRSDKKGEGASPKPISHSRYDYKYRSMRPL